MTRIMHKKICAPGVVAMRIAAPDVARRAKAGQFVVLRVNEAGERIPLTIADTNADEITIIFQEAGKTTTLLGTLEPGDGILDLIGPLGMPTEIHRYGTVVTIGGGVGVAEVYPVTKAFKAAGNDVTSIIGARSKELVILEEEMRACSDTLSITTDDGSYGRKGYVSDVVQELIQERTIDLVYAIGPLPMMRVISEITKQAGIKSVVSLNAVMLDATGMCGACRVTVAGKVRLACVEGPEFDAHHIDWDELIARAKLYKEEERLSLEQYTHRCRIRG